ncbi:hypothetical protein ACFFZP_005758 [Klebsiella pneumoniae]
MENGKLAQQQGFDLALQILKSQRGYYIGTATSEGYPVSRESAEYFPDRGSKRESQKIPSFRMMKIQSTPRLT